jgi:hypothetical protein
LHKAGRTTSALESVPSVCSRERHCHHGHRPGTRLEERLRWWLSSHMQLVSQCASLEAVTGALGLGVSLAHFSHTVRAAGLLAHFGTRVSRQPARHGVTFEDGRLAERRRWSRGSRVAWSCCRQGVDQTQRPTRCRRFPRGATHKHKTHNELDCALTFPHPTRHVRPLIRVRTHAFLPAVLEGHFTLRATR